jgi:hypothetical protein
MDQTNNISTNATANIGDIAVPPNRLRNLQPAMDQVNNISTNAMANIGDIAVPPNRLRNLQPAKVAEISESMKQPAGLLHPIVVQWGDESDYKLIAGAHRLEAAKALGWTSIAVTILNGIDADQAQLAEIDENLCRATLGASEEAAHLAARKAVYLRMHPETGHGGDRGQDPDSGSCSSAFVDDTAAKTGQSRSSVAQKTARGEHIDDVASLAGTTLDKGAELDALAKKPKEEQRKLAKQAKAGLKVSARAPKKAKATKPKPVMLDSMAFVDADIAVRRKFLDAAGFGKVFEALPPKWRLPLIAGLKQTPDDMPKEFFDKLTPAHLPEKLSVAVAKTFGVSLGDAKEDEAVAKLKSGGEDKPTQMH